MIHPKEIMLGNWINFYSSISGQTKPMQVDVKWFGSIADQNDSSPIPLTPEVLEKCGFVLDTDAGNWNRPNYKIYTRQIIEIAECDGKYLRYNSCEDDYYSTYWPELFYLHQLQNLIFALTGTELEYKP